MLRDDQPPELIDWANVEYFASHVPAVKLRVSHERIARLHPRDIGRLVDQLAYRQGAELIAALDEETAAGALEEITPDRQADLIQRMDEERAADILDEMHPDDAADLLADLSLEKAADLLTRMEPDGSADVRSLMQYRENTAGGIMTTDFVAVPTGSRVADVLERLRRQPELPDTLTAIYVVDDLDNGRLRGVLSLRNLILADPGAAVAALMATDYHAFAPGAEAEKVGRAIVEYRLLEAPVVDPDGRIIGVVTVDDALEQVMPEPRHDRASRVFG
jgi:Mg/Co/Ni transporter MgtE